MTGVGLAGAFLGGILTLLSPCSVLLLPAFFSYAFSSAGMLVSRTGAFYLGLVTTMVPLGMLAGTLGAVVSQQRGLLLMIASAVIIVLGVIQLIGIPLPGIGRLDGRSGASAISVYLLGTVYGLAGFCAGPILGAVLTLAAVSGSALYGGIVLLVYAAGMVVPLLTLALLWDRIPRLRDWLRPRQVVIGRWSNSWTSVIGGMLTIAIGVVLILTDGTIAVPGILDAQQQVNVESQVLAGAGQISDWLVVGAAVLVLGMAYALRRWMKTRDGVKQSD
ncbi:MAG: cytochrome c biogenesis CcdA family protein [Propionicimonas sp.]